MRTISVSADVFSEIWKRREAGEENEDQILRRVFNISNVGASDTDKNSPAQIGFYDKRNQVTFPPGFEIFATYKNQNFSASAVDGQWLRTDNGKQYRSLNQLTQSIVDNAVNAWEFWQFRDETTGSVKKLTTKRDPDIISTRS